MEKAVGRPHGISLGCDTHVSPHPEPSSPPPSLFSPLKEYFIFFFFKVYLVSHSSSVKIAWDFTSIQLYLFSFFWIWLLYGAGPDRYQTNNVTIIMTTLCNLCLLRKQRQIESEHTLWAQFLWPACLQQILWDVRELSGLYRAPEPWAALPGTELLQQGAEVRGEEREQHWTVCLVQQEAVTLQQAVGGQITLFLACLTRGELPSHLAK